MIINLAIERIAKGQYRIGIRKIEGKEKAIDFFPFLTDEEAEQLRQLPGIQLIDRNKKDKIYSEYEIVTETLEIAEQAWEDVLEPSLLLEYMTNIEE